MELQQKMNIKPQERRRKDFKVQLVKDIKLIMATAFIIMKRNNPDK